MSDRLRKNLIKYGSCVAAGLLTGCGYLSGKDIFNQPLIDQYRLLSDAFMLPGFLMVAVGLLIFLANEGAFTGVGFIAQKAVGLLIPFLYKQKGETYGQYVERKTGKPTKGYGFLLICGCVFLAVSAVFVVLFNQVHG